MEQFGEILKKSIHTLNLSVAQFAKQSGINRGQLYSVFEGKKNIPEKKFLALFHTFTFAAAQKQQLQESYYAKFYGDDKFSKIQYMIDRLNQLSDEEKHPYRFVSPPKLKKEEFENLALDKENIALLIANIIYDEAKQDAPKMITNFPFSFDVLDRAIYSALSHCQNRLDFQHIICFDQTGAGVHNWRNMFQSIKYLRLKYNVWYHHGQNEEAAFIDNAFPYYFLSSAYLVLINQDCTTALLMTDQKAIDSYFSQLNEAVSKCKPLAFFPNDALDFKDAVAKVGINETWAHFSYYPCCVTRPFTSEVLHEIGQDLENREALINAVLNHYSMITATADKHYFAQFGGYKQFAKDGKSYEIPGKYVKNMPPHIRCKIFKENLEDIKNKKIFLDLIKEEKLLLPKYLFLQAFKSNLFIMLGYCSENVSDRYYGEFCVMFSDNMLSDDIRNLQNYLLQSDYCHSQDVLLYLLNELIAECGSDETPCK